MSSNPLSIHSSDKVIVGLSGGVDSAVAALTLKNQGYAVEAMFMKNWEDDDGSEYCTARQDFEDAMRIADVLDIELHAVNFAREYWDNVFSHFLSEYKVGRTPNPDVLCNREIKFKVFQDHASKLGAHWIATGHYCRKTSHNGTPMLLKGLDPNKDQSYFLNAVTTSQLTNALFPIGELEKTEVRRIAESINLHVHNKKDSTGICFIGERRFKDFLENYIPAQPGDIQNEHDETIGEHQGLMFHTIGQRQGLGIGGVHGASEQPWYVAQKQLESNTLVVVQGHNHRLLMKQQLLAVESNWISEMPEFPLICSAKTRYRQADQQCTVSQQDDGMLVVDFDQSQRAITPGQYVVFYSGDQCLGGAIIQS